jgi:hypothetical protein
LKKRIHQINSLLLLAFEAMGTVHRLANNVCLQTALNVSGGVLLQRPLPAALGKQ